ncbi:hypothetical protein OS242_10340 [Tumebacillus sp. DT12]|uniref:HNH endonuclease n=1 Tax=Tumebacillus lacus TaxID=2995335 RepID=A0ABT3X0C9_9BACL|nr:hypothetical protein [Tumebacillus lacus]MCX7570362.1 hypothetical protein [Tumebacillus lacus]
MAKILTDLSKQPVRSFAKPEKAVKEMKRSSFRSGGKKQKKAKNPAKKVEHKRGSAKAGDRTTITKRVIVEVTERAGGVCEMCGLAPQIGTFRDRLELAHLIQAGQLGRGDIPWNIAHLCGPSVNTGTCHWKIDSRRKTNRHLVEELIAKLERLYDKSEWPDTA